MALGPHVEEMIDVAILDCLAAQVLQFHVVVLAF